MTIALFKSSAATGLQSSKKETLQNHVFFPWNKQHLQRNGAVGRGWCRDGGDRWTNVMREQTSQNLWKATHSGSRAYGHKTTVFCEKEGNWVHLRIKAFTMQAREIVLLEITKFGTDFCDINLRLHGCLATNFVHERSWSSLIILCEETKSDCVKRSRMPLISMARDYPLIC